MVKSVAAIMEGDSPSSADIVQDTCYTKNILNDTWKYLQTREGGLFLVERFIALPLMVMGARKISSRLQYSFCCKKALDYTR